MAGHISIILMRLLDELVEEGVLELAAGATVPALVDELLAAFAAQSGRFAQFGRTVSAALIASPLVEELYESDADLAQRLNHISLR